MTKKPGQKTDGAVKRAAIKRTPLVVDKDAMKIFKRMVVVF